MTYAVCGNGVLDSGEVVRTAILQMAMDAMILALLKVGGIVPRLFSSWTFIMS